MIVRVKVKFTVTDISNAYSSERRRVISRDKIILLWGKNRNAILELEVLWLLSFN